MPSRQRHLILRGKFLDPSRVEGFFCWAREQGGASARHMVENGARSVVVIDQSTNRAREMAENGRHGRYLDGPMEVHVARPTLSSAQVGARIRC